LAVSQSDTLARFPSRIKGLWVGTLLALVLRYKPNDSNLEDLMKTTLLSLVVAMMIPAISSAKVEDFNAMINENQNAQMQLRNELKEQMNETRQAQMPKKEMIEVAGAFDSSVNTPTKKALTTYDKEMVHYRPSEEKQTKRLANEIKAADKSF
jgi:hypothetical protein